MSYWTLIRQNEHTARKEHTCSGCHHKILPGQTYTRQEGLSDYRWETWKDCGRCVPWHENVAGSYVRPIDVLEDLEENWDDPNRHPERRCWDGATLTIYGLEVERYDSTNEAVYQASLIPGTGLTGWTKVARWTPRRIRQHRGQESAYEELTGGDQ